MIAIDKEDFLEEEELYDDFNAYGLPIRPINHRGVARAYRPNRRKARMNSGGTRPMSRPKRRRPVKGAYNILLPRKKAIAFGKPRRIPLKKSPLLKVTPPVRLPKSKKKNTPIQRASPRRSAKTKAKALKEEITQKNEVSQDKPKMSKKKKLLILGLTVITVTITGYLIYNAQKKDGL